MGSGSAPGIGTADGIGDGPNGSIGIPVAGSTMTSGGIGIGAAGGSTGIVGIGCGGGGGAIFAAMSGATSFHHS